MPPALKPGRFGGVLELFDKFEYGKFGWIVDPKGIKIEFWEPKDENDEEMLNPDEPNKSS